MLVFFSKKSDTLEFSMHAVSSCNIVEEKNSFMLKKKKFQKIHIDRKHIAGNKKKVMNNIPHNSD